MNDVNPNTRWRHKLLRKPSVVVALGIIGLTTIIAIFAYQFAPDDTPYANHMIVELGAKEPGFTTQLLYVPKTTVPAKGGLLSRIFSGTPSAFNTVPINSYALRDDELLVTHYIDDDIQDTIIYPISSLAVDKTAGIAEQRQYVQDKLIKQKTFYLGTDRYGRDILSRLLIGARVSLSVGFIAVLLSITIGIFLGSLAGYYGGITDNLVMWFINILWAIPTLLLVFAITLTIGKGFWQIFIAIGLTMWVSAARLIRGQAMALKEMEYITAAKALGLSDGRIIYRHILPNIAGPIMVIAASNFATAILIEAGLSFLGIGVQPPTPSWGLMIKEHYNFLLTNRPLLAIIPGLAIMLLVYAFNILGNALRDVLDVRG
ncbi:MAG: ABC transporter permease [Chitinophagales bacterium]|nr:ABC transporter permease [Chitinophagales bacterium]